MARMQAAHGRRLRGRGGDRRRVPQRGRRMRPQHHPAAHAALLLPAALRRRFPQPAADLRAARRARALLAQHRAIHQAVTGGDAAAARARCDGPHRLRRAAPWPRPSAPATGGGCRGCGSGRGLDGRRRQPRFEADGETMAEQSTLHAPRVGLFVTCLVDLFRPTRRLRRGQAARGGRLHGRGADGADLLRPAGLQFRRPRRHAARSPSSTIAAFEDFDYVVAPSGSCAGMLKKHYPGLFTDDPDWEARAQRLLGQGARAGQLPGRRARRDAASRRSSTAPSPITIPARACASSASRRSRGGCSRRSRALKLVEMQDADVCCGFGGTFCVKYPDISNAIVDEEDRRHRRDRRRHAAGRRPRLPDEHGRQAEAPGLEGRGAACRRGAGRHDRHAADRRSEAERMEITSPDLQGEAARGARRRRSCRRRSAMCAAASSRSAGKARRGAAGVRRAARQCARHQGPHAGQSRSLSRGLRGEGRRSRRPGALGRDGRGGARASCSTSAARPTRAR